MDRVIKYTPQEITELNITVFTPGYTTMDRVTKIYPIKDNETECTAKVRPETSIALCNAVSAAYSAKK
jgi:hypothetical protein